MIFKRFEDIVRNPYGQLERYYSEGRKVVGCFHLYTPEPIVYALGMLPFGMWGTETEICNARKYFPEATCGILKADFEMGINGRYDKLSAVIIPTLCDSLRCATQNWRCAVPNIEMIPLRYPNNRDSKGAVPYLYEQYMGVVASLEKISDRELCNEELLRAINIYNEHNEVMRQFEELAARYPKEISASDRNYVIKSACFIDKKEHTDMVREVVAHFEGIVPGRFRGIKVVTTGISFDSEELLRILDDTRVAIVADEVAQESRQYRVDAEPEEDGIMALVNQYMRMYACSSVLTGIQREQYILDLVKSSNADGVIIVRTKFCDLEEYDIPVIRQFLEMKGIPVLIIETDKQTRNYGQAATAVQSFKEMIRL